jgi:hypothetical protein
MNSGKIRTLCALYGSMRFNLHVCEIAMQIAPDFPPKFRKGGQEL